MKQQVTFSWLCDFIVVAHDNFGKEIRRIDFSEIPRKYPKEHIVRGKSVKENDSIFMYDVDGCASVATQDEIVRCVENYFKTHDLASFDLWDLWWEISCEHLYAWMPIGAFDD